MAGKSHPPHAASARSGVPGALSGVPTTDARASDLRGRIDEITAALARRALPTGANRATRDAFVRDDTVLRSMRAHYLDELAAHVRSQSSYRPPAWLERLPDFEGEVIVQGEALDVAEWDFGKVRRRRPAVVLRPAHTADVAAAVRFCRREGISLAPRGHAHSAGAQMAAEEGFVIDMKAMDRILEINDEWCDVEGGIGWGEVLVACVDKGVTPRIVTDWLAVSVGGTISMGGFGFMSFWRGTQMDNLLELEVVTGTGEVVVCSRDHRPELFDIVRGTHGKFGIITRARVPLEPTPRGVRMVQACYGSVRGMLTDFDHFTKRRETDLIHAFAAEKSRASITTRMNSTDPMVLDEASVDRALRKVRGDWVYNLELVDFLAPKGATQNLFDPGTLGCEPGLVDTWELSWKDFCFRLPPLILEEQFRGAAPHPELCVWVPMNEDGYQLLEQEFRRMRPVESVGNGPILFFPLKTELVKPSLFRLPDEPYCLFWGLLRRAEPATPERIAELRADNEVVYHRALDIGGVRYLPDTPPETPTFWAQHYGPLWPRIRQLKRTYDPDGVLSSSFGAAASA